MCKKSKENAKSHHHFVKDVRLVIFSADDQGTCDISTVHGKAKAASLHLNGIKSSEHSVKE